MSDAAGGDRLPGGFDHGAVRDGDVVRRRAGPWTPAVHDLLAFLERAGFAGAPRPVRHSATQDVVGFLPGETVGTRRPWPAWVHTDSALDQVAAWLADYHRVVTAYDPPAGARWREVHAAYGADVIIAHNDAAPYNAVWSGETLFGFVDWDMAGPRRREDDLAWTAFSWVPLHAPAVVAAEGFSDLGRRRERLERFLLAYGSGISTPEVLARLDRMITEQIMIMRDRAARGDEVYARMIDIGRAGELAAARDQLSTL